MIYIFVCSEYQSSWAPTIRCLIMQQSLNGNSDAISSIIFALLLVQSSQEKMTNEFRALPT